MIPLKSAEAFAKAVDAVTEGDHDSCQLPDQPREIDTYPERLFAPDMAAIYRCSLKRFYTLAAEGVFDFAVIRPKVGRQSWSRERVKRHVAGELRGLTGSR